MSAIEGLVDDGIARRVGEAFGLPDDELDFETHPRLAAEIFAYGIHREIGTPNDRLSLITRELDGDELVPLAAARSELIEYRGHVGVRVWWEGCPRIALDFNDVRTLLHPQLSFAADGTLRQLVFFPLSMARIAKERGSQLVIPPRWAGELLADADVVARPYYKLFERPGRWMRIAADWSLRYSRYVEERKIVAFVTHDLVDHVAGTSATLWTRLEPYARRLRRTLESLYAENPTPPLQTLILPFLAVYLLDGASQPRNARRALMLGILEHVTAALERRAIGPHEPGTLRRFPQRYGGVIDVVVAPTPGPIEEVVPALQALVDEIKAICRGDA